MRLFYRLSDSANIRVRVPGATKYNCLINLLTNFRLSKHFDAMTILADSVTEQTYQDLREVAKHHTIFIKRTSSGSEAASFKLLLDEFVEYIKSSAYNPNEIVYFAEDDYIYLPNARDILEEGFLFGDYATLRLHPDKFIPPSRGGNPLLDDRGGEETRVYQSAERFWMLTNSTGMYPAAPARIMKEDLDFWYWGVTQGRASRDFDIWLKLRDNGRKLVMPIPTGMSHNELESASPLIGTGLCCWEKGLHGNCQHDNK